MKKLIQQLSIVFTAILILDLACLSASAQAQDRIPREYTNPDEIISFDRQTPYPDAIEVIDQFAQEFEGRFVMDRTGYTGSIGINLSGMHWKDALNYILRVNNMVMVEDPEFIEILTEQQVEARRDDPEDPARPGVVMEDRIATTKTREVRINATFFEGSRRALREVGVDWSTLTSNIPENILDFTTEQGQGDLPDPSFDGRFVQVNARGAQSVSQNVFNSLINFGEIGAGIELQALFSAFEADNLGEVLATPSVKVMDGEEGRIQVGEDFSIKQRDFAGNVTDQFFSTGTILTVNPQVIEMDDTTFIYMDLEVERSSAQPDPVSTVISKENASTHTLLLNGESTVIAGLYRTDRSEVRRGIPILKDLPGWFFGLKYLFGYNSTDISQSELIVVVQAELEKSIPERMAEQLLSKREVLDNQKIRHRNEMDYTPLEEPDPVFHEADPMEPLPETGPDPEPETEPEPEPEPEPVTDPEPAEEEPEVAEEPEEVTPSPAEPERRDVDQFAGEYISVPLENMNRNHANLVYYTIGGSFQVKSNAERLYRRFTEEGFDAHLLFNPNTNFYFVAYAGFTDAEEAIEYTREIQRERQQEAWLSRIITERRLEKNSR